MATNTSEDNILLFKKDNYKSEPYVTGFLRIDDIGLMRKFRFSFPVLKNYEVWASTCQTASISTALKIIRDGIALDIDPIKAYPSTAHEIEQLYPLFADDKEEGKKSTTQKKTESSMGARQKANRLAAILWNTVREIKDSKDLSSKELASRQSAQVSSFEQHANVEIPKFDIQSQHILDLGPAAESKEPALIPYERVYVLLKSLQSALSRSKWNESFINWKVKDVFRTRIVDKKYAPKAIQTKSTTASPVYLRPDTKTDPHTFHFTRITRPGTRAHEDMETHIKNYLEYERLELPGNKTIRDPSANTTAQAWRDEIRRELDFPGLRVDFEFITCQIQGKPDTLVCLYDAVKASRAILWFKFRESLKRAAQVYQIEYALRPLKITDQSQYPYEHGGPPDTIAESIIRSENNDVQQKSLDDVGNTRDSPEKSSTGDNNTSNGTNVAESNIQENENGETNQNTDSVSSQNEVIVLDTEMKVVDDPKSTDSMTSQNQVTSAADIDKEDDNPTQASLNWAKDTMKTFLRTSTYFDAATPLALFGNDSRKEMLKYYDGFDALTPEGLRNWQEAVISEIIANETQPVAMRPIFDGSKNQKDQAEANRKIFRQEDLDVDLNQEDDMVRYKALQGAFIGSQKQTGPFVDLSAIILGMKFTGYHDKNKTISKYRSEIMPDVHAEFMDSQVNAIAWMLAHEWGKIPVHPKLTDQTAARAAAESLTAPRTLGGIIVDHVGLGKTFEGAGWLAASAELSAPTGSTSLPTQEWKPSLVLVPSAVVLKQWILVFRNYFPGMKVLTSYGSEIPTWLSLDTWLSPTAVRSAPQHPVHWPTQYKYVFDRKDSRNARTIIISTMDTFANRILIPTDEKFVKQRQSIARHDSTKQDQAKYKVKWQGFFGRLLIDEGHEFRNTATRRYAMIYGLKADVVFYLTATPIISSPDDMFGPLKIFFSHISDQVKNDQDALEAIADFHDDGSFAIADRIEAMPETGLERMFLLLNPARLKRIIRTHNSSYIQAHWRLTDELICLRRSSGAVLSCSDGRKIDLHGLMPMYIILHVEVSLTTKERQEYEWGHRAATRAFIKASTDASSLEKKLKDKQQKAKNPHLPRINTALRHLTLLSTSVILARNEDLLARIGLKSKVKVIQDFRRRGYSPHHLLCMLHRPTDGNFPTTGAEKLQMLVYGSPKARYFIREILWHGLPPKGEEPVSKLLVTEELPVSAWYFELVCSLLHVPCAVIHSALDEGERCEVVDRFNDPHDALRILIIQYGVNMAGINLHFACWRVLVMTPALSASQETQATGRAVRATQTHDVTIIRVIVENSHDTWRDIRQIDKLVSDLVTRSLSLSTRRLLVTLLNEANTSIQKDHDSTEGKRLLNGRYFVPLSETVGSLVSSGGDNDAPDPTITHWKKRIYAQEESQNPSTGIEKITEDKKETKKDHTTTDKNSGASKGHTGTENTNEMQDHHNMEDELGSDNEEDSVNRQREIIHDLAPFLLQEAAFTSCGEAQDNLRRWLLQVPPGSQSAVAPARLAFYRNLSLDPRFEYTLASLEDPDILYRALRLLIHSRLGEVDERYQLTPHINYVELPKEIRDNLAQTLSADEAKLHAATKILRDPASFSKVEIDADGDSLMSG